VQLVVGYQFLGWVDEDASEETITAIQNATIWAITFIATMSVVSGLGKGVKLLASLAFCMGTFLMVIIFIMDDSKYVLNLNVQAVGMFFQHSVFELNFWTDAFGQLREGSGRAVDGKASAVWWMDAWMIFYQAWWVSWSAFVGIFVARISRGRTVGEVIGYSFVAPIGYTILWFCTWGGIGLRQSRQAKELEVLGAAYFNDTKEFAVPNSDFCYDVPQGPIVVDGVTVFDNLVLGVTPVCKFDSSQADRITMNVLESFSFPDNLENGFGPFLVVFFLFTLAIYFVTSSDSGSLVVDHLASNGRKKHHTIQRVFWAVTVSLFNQTIRYE
jgi:choline-glycine betaine transporter